MDNEDIFEKIGGKLTVNITVDPFFERILSDDKIAPFFSDSYLDSQLAARKRFLTTLFGGYHDDDLEKMRGIHKSMVEKDGLNDEHFNAMLIHLKNTLLEAEISPELISQVMERTEGTRKYVLCR